jgi:phosphoribosylamine---glycine ligase
MNVLILGSGGREHAFSWKIAKSKHLSKLFIAPGNAGTSELGTNVNIDLNNFEKLKEFVLGNEISMVVVGPEEPLVNGIVDYFSNDKKLKEVNIVGPGKTGAMLEGSKDFAKEFMIRHKIPTARYKTFTRETIKEGFSFLETLNSPYVLKADGLAAGKGVLIIENIDEAKMLLSGMLIGKKFGNASSKVVIEEFLPGIELSVFVLTDGVSYKILPEAKDYKRVGEKDTGQNTGGMGAVSPVSFANSSFLKKVEEQIVIPTIEGLKKDNIPYKGIIFIGLMNVKGNPYVIEYNVRMGDPETEVVLPRIKSDILPVLMSLKDQTLGEQNIVLDERTAVTVVLVSGGYPQSYEKGKEISDYNSTDEDVLVFHAGTTKSGFKTLTSGGRVIAVTSFGNSIENARTGAYNKADLISFEKKYYRKDIGTDLIALSAKKLNAV